MIVSHEIKTFRKNGIVLDEALWINNMPYFSTKAIGKFLELKDGFRSIDKIVKRNPYIEQYSKTIEVLSEEIIETERDNPCKVGNYSTLCPLKDPEIMDIIRKNGGQGYYNCLKCLEKVKPKTRTRKIKKKLFHPVGLYLIILESNSPKAHEFKHRVSQLLFILSETGMVEPDLDKIETEIQKAEKSE